MMSLWSAIFILILLIIISAIVSSAEISLAGARRIKLQNMVNEGNTNAALVLKLQEQPGRFITVVQIGLNMVAVLGGVIGEATIRVYLQAFINQYTGGALGGKCRFMAGVYHRHGFFYFIRRFNAKTLGAAQS